MLALPLLSSVPAAAEGVARCQYDLPSDFKLDFRQSHMVHSQLGDDESPTTTMRIGNVGPNPTTGRMVDLEISNNSPYTPMHQAKNGLIASGSMAQINLRAPQPDEEPAGGDFKHGRIENVEFSFNFIDSETSEPVELRRFFISFFDFDEGIGGKGSECIGTKNFDSVHMDESTEVVMTSPSGAGFHEFCASKAGKESDNPSDPLVLNNEQRRRAILFAFSHSSGFVARLRVKCCVQGGRNFLIGGHTELQPQCLPPTASGPTGDSEVDIPSIAGPDLRPSPPVDVAMVSYSPPPSTTMGLSPPPACVRTHISAVPPGSQPEGTPTLVVLLMFTVLISPFIYFAFVVPTSQVGFALTDEAGCAVEDLEVVPNEESVTKEGDDAQTTTDTKAQQPTESSSFLKWLGLGMLICQNSALFCFLRLTRHVKGPGYSAAVAVMCTELGKLTVCLNMIGYQHAAPRAELYNELWVKRSETLKLAVPALCYTIQNNLLFIAASYISAVVLQAITQTKTLWAAVFSVTLLGRKFSPLDWLSFLILIIGVVIVQTLSPEALQRHTESAACENTPLDAFRALGSIAAAGAAMLSGFAGVFLELMYTRKGASLWMRNVQLCVFTIPIQSLAVLQQLLSGSVQHLFAGFHFSTWVVVMIQVAGGLITALVIKYAGNMPKTFAAAVALVCTSLISIPLFGYWNAPPMFWVGVMTVSGATLLFEGRKPLWALISPRIQWAVELFPQLTGTGEVHHADVLDSPEGGEDLGDAEAPPQNKIDGVADTSAADASTSDKEAAGLPEGEHT